MREPSLEAQREARRMIEEVLYVSDAKRYDTELCKTFEALLAPVLDTYFTKERERCTSIVDSLGLAVSRWRSECLPYKPSASPQFIHEHAQDDMQRFAALAVGAARGLVRSGSYWVDVEHALEAERSPHV